MSDVLDTSTLTRWQRQPLNFITEILRDPETAKPFVLLDAERAFLEHAYQIDDQRPAGLSRAALWRAEEVGQDGLRGH